MVSSLSCSHTLQGGNRLLSSQGNLAEEGSGSSGSLLVDYVTGV